MGLLPDAAGDVWIERVRADRRAWLMLFDGATILSSYVGFSAFRYGSELTGDVLGNAATLGALAVIAQWSAGSAARLYQGRATVASFEETALLCLVALGCGWGLVVGNLYSTGPLLARSVPAGATFMALLVMLLARATWRSAVQRHGFVASSQGEPTLVFGAGEAGRQLVHAMLRGPASGMRPVGLLDDDTWKRRLRLHGVPVLGTRDDIATAARVTGARLLVIAVPSAGASLVGEVSTAAREAGLAVKVLPSLAELFGRPQVDIRDVRAIDVHDLLGRGPVETDVASIADYVTGKRVLVTGAGGSIGSELCRQLHTYRPAELMMLDRDESALHAVQLSIHGRALLDSSDVVLADIRDRDTLGRIFLDRRPEVVFHAAALKHLPMLEQYPVEAMKTNVLGTANVLDAAVMVGVERFVNISTDKAANPASVLGYSKRVAERLTAFAAQEISRPYLSVRFGNVLGSRGSVLTSFAAQIAAGGPVTVTHPDVTRYFMTVQEAVQLVIQAAAIGAGGEVLILDMGEPVRIVDVAQQLIDQSGREIEVVFTGLRDGEKLHEHLFGQGEAGERRVHPLVSHVSVPALPIWRARTTPLGVARLPMVEQLAHLATLPDDSELTLAGSQAERLG